MMHCHFIDFRSTLTFHLPLIPLIPSGFPVFKTFNNGMSVYSPRKAFISSFLMQQTYMDDDCASSMDSNSSPNGQDFAGGSGSGCAFNKLDYLLISRD